MFFSHHGIIYRKSVLTKIMNRRDMQRIIRLDSGDTSLEIVLNDTETSKKIFASLPVESSANRWGDEIYFYIPVEAELEDPKEILDVGDIAYWPPGNAFCIFFGPTPASTSDNPQAASPVTVVGSLKDLGDIDLLRGLRSGNKISLSVPKSKK